jgi:hypothetical protein
MCGECKKRVKSHDINSINKKLEELGLNYTCVDRRAGKKAKSKFYCEIHDCYFDARPDSVFSGNLICKHCKIDAGLLHDIDSINKKLIENGIKYRCKEYNGYNENSIFSCPVDGHENFIAKTSNIVVGHSHCSKCSGRVSKHTTETFNDKLREVGLSHYTLVSEIESVLKVAKFYCEVHDHYFDARPSDVLTGNTKCRKCSKRLESYTKDSINEHLHETGRNLKLLGEYTNSRTPTLFGCDVCDYEWLAKPSGILYGKGCPCCAGVLKSSKEKINKKLEDENKPVRLVGEFINMKTRARFRCEICEYEWDTPPNSIMNCGTGCPKCAKYGFDPSKPAWLYYFEIDNHGQSEYENLYKIGITNTTFDRRYNKTELKKMKLLFKIYFENGATAYVVEQKLIKQFAEFCYSGPNILGVGNTEIFVYDIFGYK